MQLDPENKNIKQIPIYLITVTVATIIYILHVIPIFSKTPNLWGSDQWRYQPLWSQLVLIGLAVLSLIPCLGKVLFDLLNRLILKVKPILELVPGWAKNIILAIASFSLLWIFRQRTHFLGDGYLCVRDLARGEQLYVNEPLEVFMHAMIYSWLNKIKEVPAETVYALVSITCGIIFVFFVLKFTKILSERMDLKILTVSALFFTGTVQLFFGYVENYTILALFVTIYLYFGYKAANQDHNVIAATLFCMLAICSHVIGIVLIPSLLYLLVLDFKRKKSWRERIKIAVFNFLAAAGVIAIVALGIKLGTGENIFEVAKEASWGGNLIRLKASNAPGMPPFGLISKGHFNEFLNLYVLIATFSFFSLFLLILIKEIRQQIIKMDNLFLIICSAAFIAFSFIFNPRIGASRDWDLFAAGAIPVTILSVSLLKSLETKQLHRIGFLMISCLVLHTVPWLYINSSEGLSLKRFLKLIESPYWTEYAKGYGLEEVGQYYNQNMDYENAIYYLELAYRMTGSQRHLGSVISAYNNLSIEYTKNKDFESAITELDNALELDPNSDAAHYNLGFNLRLAGRLEEAIPHLEKAVELAPGEPKYMKVLSTSYYEMRELDKTIEINKKLLKLDPRSWETYNNIGVVYLEKKDYVSCAEYMQFAFMQGIDNPNLHVNMGIAVYNLGKEPESIEIFKKALLKYPGSVNLLYAMGSTLNKMGRSDEARIYLHRVLQLKPDHEMALEALEEIGNQ